MMSTQIKVAAAHPPNWRYLSYKIDDESEVLRLVDGQIERILELADEAADAGAIAVAYPEDMLGLLTWQMAHLDTQRSVLEAAVDKLLVSLSEKAKERSIYFIACNDMPNGKNSRWVPRRTDSSPRPSSASKLKTSRVSWCLI